MSAAKFCALVLGLLAGIGWAGAPVRGQADAAKPNGVQKKPRPHFTVSKETTYLTGPRNADGFIDYLAALNERLGQGVKPEDNANVYLWRAFGPHPEGSKTPPAFFRRLGIDEPPEKGDYYVHLIPFLKNHPEIAPKKDQNEIIDEQDEAGGRPWKAKEFPYLAAWLRANEKPLVLIVRATRCPHHFAPLVANKLDGGTRT
jgi:hypothetical protein